MIANKNISIDELAAVGAHFAYTPRRRHPSAKPYILGVKNKLEIFDLEKTAPLLEKALDFVRELGTKKSQIILVGGKKEAQESVRKAGEALGMPYVAGRWIGGTLTNFAQIRKRVEKLESLVSAREKGELGKYTKKERLLIDREIETLTKLFSGLSALKSLPKVILVIDSGFEHIAVAEAKTMGLPIVALNGSDCDLSMVNYPVPANDASKHSVGFFMEKITEAYKDGEANAPEIKKVEVVNKKVNVAAKK